MKAITHTGEALTENYVLGALSCIIWTLTLQTTIKYVLIALRADNHGEGGILALYALLRRHKRRWIYAIAVIGASTLLADGVITPAITITTAIEGLRGINPDIPVLPVAIAVITVVFFVQRFGTEHVGRSFGTFMLLWFMLLGVVGLMWLIGCPQVLKAFNPYYAARLLIESPVWFLVLGAVFLCTTGAEALYSDLGHCGKHNIAISWILSRLCSSSTISVRVRGCLPIRCVQPATTILLCHHARRHAALCRVYGNGCGHRGEPGAHQRFVLNIE